MTFDEKRKILRSYTRLPQKIYAEHELLLHLRSESVKITSSLTSDGSAHRGVNADKMAKIIESITETEEKARQLEEDYIRLSVEIPAAIAKLGDENERSVLFWHYIKGLYIWQIEPILNYSDRQLKRFAVNGIEHIEL